MAHLSKNHMLPLPPKYHKKILHHEVVHALHNEKFGQGMMMLGFGALVVGLLSKPSITGGVIAEATHISATTYFSSIVVIVGFMMIWTGLMVYLMKGRT